MSAAHASTADLRHCLAEMRRVLCDGGVLYVDCHAAPPAHRHCEYLVARTPERHLLWRMEYDAERARRTWWCAAQIRAEGSREVDCGTADLRMEDGRWRAIVRESALLQHDVLTQCLIDAGFRSVECVAVPGEAYYTVFLARK